MHQIRLHGPWEVRTADAEEPRRVQMPCKLGELVDEEESGGEITLTRGFHWPTNLDEDEIVSVVVKAPAVAVHVRLDHRLLGEVPELQSRTFAIEAISSNHWTARHELSISLELPDCPSATTGLWQLVGIRIDRQATTETRHPWQES